MEDIHRRSFLRGLAGAFGALSITDLQARIIDAGRPILLKRSVISNQIFVADNGCLALGDIWTPDEMEPVTWAQYFIDCGARTREQIASEAYGWNVDNPETTIGEEDWPIIFDARYRPLEAGYYFLKQNRVGSTLKNKYKTAGRLDFFAGSNHPGSRDLWVEAYDNFSVSLLQARLIELGHPIEIVMEHGGVWKEDIEAYGDDPIDE